MGVGTEELIKQVKKLLGGELQIPSIQRGYVWKRTQIPRLLDSLYRDYPVGSLLIWDTDLDFPVKTAAVIQSTPQYGKPGVLLDGQQRLTSLAWVYRPEAAGPGIRVPDVRFDIRVEEFLLPSAVQRRDPFLIPVGSVLADDAQFASLLKPLGIGFDHPNYEEFYERLNRLRSVRDYQMPVQSVSSNDYETVAEIFARVNTGGRRLSKGDLVMSAIAARWDEGVERVEAFETELRDQDFPLHREAVLRLMSVMAGVGADHVRLLRKEMDGPALKQAWETTQDALRVGIQFLKNDAGIPKSGLLTSPNVTVVPSYLLHKGRERLSPREAELLVRWTYTAMAFSRYSNQVESKLDAEIKVLDERRGEEALTDLIRRASDPRPVGTPLTSSDLLDKKSSSALFHLMYIRALRSKAKDWWNNLALADTPVGRGHKIEYHHIFPKARLKGRYTSDLVDSVANLAFLSALGNKRVSARDPAKYLANADSQELNKQWIPSDKILWDVAKFEQFLGARRTLIADALNEMLGLKDQTSTADLGQTVGEDPEDAVIDELQEESDELWTEE